MHPAPIFHWDDRGGMLAFVTERAFATIVDSERRVAQAPLIVDGDRLLLHLSRANPIAQALPQHVVAVVSGPDAYISPDWYSERDQVPTWSYVSVELRGQLVATDDTMLREILERQSAVFESWLAKPPWAPAAMSPSVLEAKLKGIIGVTMAIDSIRGTRKLSQNKSAADRAAVATALEASPRDADRVIAKMMKEP